MHPSIGLSAGIVSATVGFSAPAVIAAIALAYYLKPVFPIINEKFFAIIVILAINAIHGFSLRFGKFFQIWSTSFKLFVMFLFIFAGIFSLDKQNISFLPNLSDLDILFSPEFAVNLVWVSYAYAGWNSSIYVLGEIQKPGKNIFRSILIGTTVVTFLYILLNYVFLVVSPISDLKGEIEVGYISGLSLFGVEYAGYISLLIGLLLLSTVSSYIYVGPRIIQAIGKDYDQLSFLSKINKNGIPFNAFTAQLVISLVFILTSTFKQVVLYTGIILIITTTITVCSLLYLRIIEPDLKRPYRTWGYPYTPIIFVMLNLWVLFYTFTIQPVESIVGVCMMIFSLGLFYILKKESKYES